MSNKTEKPNNFKGEKKTMKSSKISATVTVYTYLITIFNRLERKDYDIEYKSYKRLDTVILMRQWNKHNEDVNLVAVDAKLKIEVDKSNETRRSISVDRFIKLSTLCEKGKRPTGDYICRNIEKLQITVNCFDIATGERLTVPFVIDDIEKSEKQITHDFNAINRYIAVVAYSANTDNIENIGGLYALDIDTFIENSEEF